MSIESRPTAAELSMDHGSTKSVILFHDQGSLAEHLVTAHGVDSVEALAHTFSDHTMMHARTSRPARLDDILPVSHPVRDFSAYPKKG